MITFGGQVRHPSEHSIETEEKQQSGLSQRKAQSPCWEFQTGDILNWSSFSDFVFCLLYVEMLNDNKGAPPSATLLMNSSLIDSLMAKAAPENRPPPQCSSDEADVDIVNMDEDDDAFPIKH